MKLKLTKEEFSKELNAEQEALMNMLYQESSKLHLETLRVTRIIIDQYELLQKRFSEVESDHEKKKEVLKTWSVLCGIIEMMEPTKHYWDEVLPTFRELNFEIIDTQLGKNAANEAVNRSLPGFPKKI